MNDRVYNNEIERLRSTERIERLEVDKVVANCVNDKISSVLDVGIGSGLFAGEFLKYKLKVSGVDINPDMIEAAKKYVPEAEIQKAPAESLPYPDDSFDIVFMGLVFHEVDDFKKSLEEAFRVSIKGAYILEWVYRVEDFGPPLQHRLKSDFIINLAEVTGFKFNETVRFRNLLLYKLKK